MNTKVKIAITTGCPKGVGPEIVEKAENELNNICELTVYGERYWRDNIGKETAGRMSFNALENATEAVIRGEHDALVTAPINKAYWNEAGINFIGHTEYLASKTETTKYAMMMSSPKLKVVIATIHEPIRNISELLTQEKIITAATLTMRSLRTDFSIPYPKIAIASLNPHAGDNGLLGQEEIEIISPAIDALKRSDINVSGPHPADTVFAKALNGDFDAVVAMYHDQGLAPIKTIDYQGTVNVTLGLPIIRTSVDHGTAEDIAGSGTADYKNLIAAVKTAINIHNNRWTTLGEV